jgi:16S rRNA A1518/A1519 N6-dimethyltransferase RsmA/KsgA/DIM1 with predicted DNA glycosylase/AP lyase activity
VFAFAKKERLQFALWGKIIFTVVKTAFQQRRKTMRNSLKTMNLSDSLRRPIFDLRPEQLDVAQFIELTKKRMEFKISKNLILELEQHIVNKTIGTEALLVTCTMLILLRFWMSLILMKQPIF